MINDLRIKSSNGNAIFVDDTTSFEIVKNNQESTAQVIVNEIADWLIQNKFPVQPRKCKELRISFKHAPSVFRGLYINGPPIETVDSFQVRGLTIQSNLKWDQQVEKICKKASKRLYFLSQLKRDLMKFYVTCIRLLLTYPCEVYNFNIQEKQKSPLEHNQKRAMRIFHGFDTPKMLPYLIGTNSAMIFYSRYLVNTNEKLFKYLSFNTNKNLLRNIRKVLVPKCNIDRFKNYQCHM